MANAYVWISGISRGNPGPSAIGVIVKKPTGDVLATLSQSLGSSTQNVAEYQALISALGEAKKQGVTRVVIYTDSILIREQLMGVLKQRAKHLEPLALMANILMKSYEHVEIIPVEQDRNKEARRLAQEAVQAESARKR
jgi:ribonuclease HI